jgi:toxin CptA
VPNYFMLHPSRVCSILLLSVYLLAILSILMLPILALAKAALALILVCSLVYCLYRDAWLLLSSSCVALHLDGNNIILATRSGGKLTGQVLRDSVVTPVLTVLNVSVQGMKSTRSVVVFPDSMDKERFRELRVLLKWGG